MRERERGEGRTLWCGYIIRWRWCERGIHPGPSKAVAELLELFLPVTRGDLHLNKPGEFPRERARDVAVVMVRLSSPRNERQDQFAEVSSLLPFYYPVYPVPVFLLLSIVYFYTVDSSTSLNLRSHAQTTRTETGLLMHFYWAIILRNLNPSIEPRLYIMLDTMADI